MARSYPILCGSIAGSIGGMGVKMHNAAFRAMNLPYTYVSFEPTSAKEAAHAMRSLGIRGLGVTMPFKEEIIEYLDDLDEMSREIGAINTIVNYDGRLKGYNTDVYGAMTSLLEVTSLEDKKVVVVGAGGGAKTIVWGLKTYTKNITLYNRNPQRGHETARRFGIDYIGGLDKLNPSIDYDILINCTSIGFKSKETILTRDKIRPNTLILDLVFTPIITTLNKEAKAACSAFIPGTRMIMHQACKQFELYTNTKPPLELYEKEMANILGGK